MCMFCGSPEGEQNAFQIMSSMNLFHTCLLLLRFAVYGVLTAEPAILVEFKPIRRVLFVFHRVVVSLLTFVASECDFYSHSGPPIFASLL